MAIVKSGGKYGYIDKREKKSPPVSGSSFLCGRTGSGKGKNKWGVIDETGAYVIAPTYSNAGPAYSDGLLAVRDNKEKWGFIDKEGQTVIPFQYKSVHPLFHESMTAVQAENKLWGFVDNTGNVTAERSSRQSSHRFPKASPVSGPSTERLMPKQTARLPSWRTMISSIL